MTTAAEVKPPEKAKAAAPDQPVTSPRKRRRRAPASGAADDCFSCQDSQQKCDRKRPYCTQCLDHGKGCSGYKTALTWNIGVASRGKLRGLSLPIAKSKKVEQSPEPPKSTRKKTASSRPAEPISSQWPSQVTSSGQPFAILNDNGAVRHISTPTNHALVTSPMLPPPNLTWPRPLDCSHHHGTSTRYRRVRPHSLRPLDMPSCRTARGLEGMPMSAHALGGYTDHDFGVSVECSPTASSFAGFEPRYDGFARAPVTDNPAQGNSFTGNEILGWPRDNMSSSLSSDQSSRDYSGDETFFADPIVANTLDEILSGAQPALHGQELVAGDFSDISDSVGVAKFRAHRHPSAGLVTDDCGAHLSFTLPRPLPALSIRKTLGIPYLIDYFDKIISPVIVAFDGPSNPYRAHILRLAAESETLQHAIAALSTTNLRQRRSHNSLTSNRSRQRAATSLHDRPADRYGVMESLPDHFSQHNETPSLEELYYKSSCIKSLNEQLIDPTRVLDDSILATLLILCLYHICDTGVAKFKNQFAGVKKILESRGSNNSKAINWLTIMFTWFEGMTADFNDRDGQVSGDETDLSTEEETGRWALENLAGCDARLFQIISKLGRLNLLSQNRAVRESELSKTVTARTASIPITSTKSQDYYSMTSKRAHCSESPLQPKKLTAQFWKEWSETRKQLQDWQLRPSLSTISESPQHLDLTHISESFRYSALLYMERLAYPHLPSAHPQLQTIVKPALHHIPQVKSDVFLLWPLFIAGTECVSKQARFMIRQRCLDIQRDSGFFNNISCLDVLERAWRDDDGFGVVAYDYPSSHHDCEMHQHQHILAPQPSPYGFHDLVGGPSGHGFKWRKAMERVDGELMAA